MQVLRVGEIPAGQDILKFLKAARKLLDLSSKFELLGDFKDLIIKKEMDRNWFESLQVGRKCEHRIGKLRTRCTCTEYLPPRGASPNHLIAAVICSDVLQTTSLSC